MKTKIFAADIALRTAVATICSFRKARLVRSIFALALLLTPLQPAQALIFLTNGSLSIGRAYHTTTLLSTGKLLVAGGYNGLSIATSELYDPTTGTSATNATMATGRYQHTATLLPNGKVLVAGGLTFPGGSSLHAVATAELYDPVSGTWTATGTMNTARYQHTANLLGNGKVLVAGGDGTNNAATNSAEIYDPATGAWTLTGSMTTPRTDHTATLLVDGTVLAAGGTNSGFISSSELYNPSNGTWTLTAGAMTASRYNHTATLMFNGQVLVEGGVFLGVLFTSELYNPSNGTWTTTTGSLNSRRCNNTATWLTGQSRALVVSGYYNNAANLTTNTAELYDPVSQTWQVVGTVNKGRAFHTATLLPAGQLVLIGGYNGTNYLSSVETYEPTNGTWSALNPMSAGRSSHTLTLLTNGLVLAAGGSSNNSLPTITELYNPLTGNWTNTTGALNFGKYDHTATLLPSGQVLVAGGYNNSAYLSSAEIYNPATQLWTVTNHMNVSRAYHTATLLNNGQVLIAGGYSNSAPFAGTETYNPSTGIWTTNGPLITPRSQHTATMLQNGKVLVAGGFGTGSTSLSSVELFDPSSGTWSTNAPMKVARGAHTATLLPSGKVLVAGGFNSSNYWQNSAELYDPTAGTWTLTGSMSYFRENHVAKLLVNGQVLIAGGSGDAATFSAAEVYEPATGTWLQVGPMISARSESASAIIHNGWVMVTGGYGTTGPLSSAEAFLNFGATSLPGLSATNSPFIPLGSDINFSGALFRGISEGSGGNGSQDSPTDYPLVQLLGLENGQSRFLTITNWTNNSLTSAPVTNFPFGWALATIMVNGNPSAYKLVDVIQGTATVTLSNLTQFYDGTAKSVSVSTVPAGLAVSLTYNGSSAAPTNVGYYAVTAIVNDANYQGGATNTLQILAPLSARNFGVDASHFQNSNGVPETNWMLMYDQDARFAFVKATEGLTGPDDPTMSINLANASQAGLLVGVYHFAHPENRPTTNGAVQEADHLLSYAGSAIGPGWLRPVLDIETTSSNLPPSVMTDWVLAFSQEITMNRGLGAAPIVYCSQDFANYQFDSRLAGTALWLEAYASGNPTNGNPATNGYPSPTGIFTNWAFWQYTIGSEGGIISIDLDVCHDEMAPLSSYLIPAAASSFRVGTATVNASGFNISFTNVPGTHFTLLSATNMSLPLSNWTAIGTFTEVVPGQFQFLVTGETNHPAGFYRVRSP